MQQQLHLLKNLSDELQALRTQNQVLRQASFLLESNPKDITRGMKGLFKKEVVIDGKIGEIKQIQEFAELV